MESLEIKLRATQGALKTLHEALVLIKKPEYQNIYHALRDSVIKSFEYSIDTFWKYLKEYLEVTHKVMVPVASAKSIFRECVNLKIINEQEFEICIAMVDARNLTSHAYNEKLAQAIASNITEYYKLMNAIVYRLNKN